MSNEADNASFYNTDSSRYDEQRWESKSGVHTNRVQQRIVQELCHDWSDGRILEIGPGTARFSIPLARQKNKLTLLDISEGMLEMAQTNIEAADLGEQIEAYLQGSVYELPFEDDSFDHVISLNVFNHLENTGDALAQMARVLKPGSTLLFNYANLHSYYWLAGRRINRRATAVGQDVYSVWEKPGLIRRIIEEAGLKPVKRVGHVHMPRAMEKLRLLPLVKVMDGVSRNGALSRWAPIHFCLCRKPE